MPMQMYFVAVRGEMDQKTSRELQELIYHNGGFTLMVTRTGQVAALDDSKVPTLSKHPIVRNVGGVTLNPRGFAAERLQKIFAQNLSRQLDLSKLEG